jgi:hypothetical protein
MKEQLLYEELVIGRIYHHTRLDLYGFILPDASGRYVFTDGFGTFKRLGLFMTLSDAVSAFPKLQMGEVAIPEFYIAWSCYDGQVTRLREITLLERLVVVG